MALVRVALDARSYDIVIEQGALDRAGDRLASYARQGRLVVVTDAHVAAAQLPRLEASLRAADVAIEPIILPPGEQTKSWPHLEQLLDALLARRATCVDRISGILYILTVDAQGLNIHRRTQEFEDIFSDDDFIGKR